MSDGWYGWVGGDGAAGAFWAGAAFKLGFLPRICYNENEKAALQGGLLNPAERRGFPCDKVTGARP